MKKQKVDAKFMKQLKDLPICSDVDNADRYLKKDGYNKNETHLAKLKMSFSRYNSIAI